MIAKRIRSAVLVMLIVLTAAFTSAGALAADLPEELVPVGDAIGISIKTKGVIVSEISEMDTKDGKISPARNAGILPGDIITEINGQEVNSAADIELALNKASETITVRLIRDGSERQVTLEPYMTDEGAYIGLWLRDGMTGIGTVTFYDPATKRFGALGHSVSDPSTGNAVPLREGEIMSAQITSVTPGRSGAPGQLGGVFNFDDICGSIDENCKVGIFGVYFSGNEDNLGSPIPVSKEEDIKVGECSHIVLRLWRS